MGGWDFYDISGALIYLALGATALWGVFCIVIVWSRIAQKRFRTEDVQSEFLDTLEEPLARGDFDTVVEMCQGNDRAVPQLVQLAVLNRGIGYNKVRQLVVDRFQRDILSDLDHRLSWVNTVIKSAPMLGLLGTVVGMMGAFGQLAAAEDVEPQDLAENISLALITTAVGLSIAIPLILCMASINVRIRQLEDLVGAGLTRFFDSLKIAMGRKWRQE